MNTLRLAHWHLIDLGLFLLAACGDNAGVEPRPVATNIAVNAGNNQSAGPGAPVATPPSVKVTDADANPVGGVSVTFAVASGGGSITGENQTTNPSGIATVGNWTLGPSAGTNTLTATAAGLTGSPVTFTATGTVGSSGLSFAAVTAGLTHTCGVTLAGAAHCWGWNLEGELGIGTTTGPESCPLSNDLSVPCSTTPVPVAGGVSFASVSVGGSHSCGITAGGAAYCWGWNLEGQLGMGTTTGPESCALSKDFSVPCSTTPVPVAGGVSFALISVGTWHSCGITAAGTAYCWGHNYYGQLGVGTRTGPETCPTSETESVPCSTLPVLRHRCAGRLMASAALSSSRRPPSIGSRRGGVPSDPTGRHRPGDIVSRPHRKRLTHDGRARRADRRGLEAYPGGARGQRWRQRKYGGFVTGSQAQAAHLPVVPADVDVHVERSSVLDAGASLVGRLEVARIAALAGCGEKKEQGGEAKRERHR